MSNAILLISCKDQKGITATVTNFVFENGGNIEHADQHIDKETNTFFMRLEWALENFKVQKSKIKTAFGPIAHQFAMEWSIYFSDDIPRVAIFTSAQLHCFEDLLWRYKSGQFKCEIPLVISNHTNAKGITKSFSIQFHHFPIAKQNKLAQERLEAELLKKERIDCIVLARYGQIFTKYFVNQYRNRIINIHHSFLPAFAGKSPYAQAYQKGVKIIGATSHYVTEKLDEGPIIEQDTVRVSHRDALNDLVLKGQDLERGVLSRALRWHLEHKILVYNNKTVIFD
ncbi:MAG: formyltetrahydrofolate deformylase [Candidatus Omnitrophota bacterium]